MTERMVPGQSVRPATTDDAEAVAALIVASDEAEGLPATVTGTDVLEDWERPRIDLSRDTRLVFSGDRLAGFGEVWEKEPGGAHEVYGSVHPDFRDRGLGGYLIDWSEERVEEGLLQNFVSSADEAVKSMLEARGYEAVRHFWHMEIELTGEETPPEAEGEVEIRAISGDDDAKVVHSIMTTAFHGHWGIVPETFEQWWESFSARSDFDAELILLAEVDGRPVGALTGQKGDGYGWVRELGVLPEARGAGIGALLLRRSFADLAQRGYPKVLLNVDSANETGATRLYERVGMRRIRQFDCYELARGGNRAGLPETR